MPGPLAQVRVLDLSRVLAGPWAGQNLADLGAEVIKIERPQSGDDARAFGPPWVKDVDGRDTSDSAYFTAANRGKKSVTVNIAHPAGQAIVRELARVSDVLIENYKFGDLARYKLGYEDLKALNPRLIYCSVTGFGQTGPWRDRPGYDFMIQGMGGMMSVTGEPDGEPQRAGVPVADIITGMYASIAICAALAHRAHSGQGQHLDLALLDSQIALLAYQNTNYFATGTPPKRIGNLHPNIVPYQPFRTADGEVIIACGNDNLYRKLCEAAGCLELAEDPRFASNGKRVENRVELTRLLQQIFARRGAGIRRAAGARAGRAPRARPSGCGQAADGREPDALLGDAARLPHAAAAAGRAHRRGPARAARQGRAGDRAPARRGRDLASSCRLSRRRP
jgi:crotonobetainyl-CoA:carnitine CoA-transferase CaiB-like acyl-CoA transferase